MNISVQQTSLSINLQSSAQGLRPHVAGGLGVDHHEGVRGAEQVSISKGNSEERKGADIYTDPRVEARAEAKESQLKLAEEQKQKTVDAEVKALSARDREVRAHEQAHMAAGGQYAGAATYEYQRGPNGVSYAVGGEVPISTSSEATPEETLRKAQIIRSAALAPAEPSSQDRKVAAMASQMEVKARSDIAQERKAESASKAETDDVESVSKKETAAVSEQSDENIGESTSNSLDHNLISSRVHNPFSVSQQITGTLLSDHA